MARIFIFTIDPVAKPRQSQYDKWRKRPCVLKYRDFADELRAQAARNGFQLKNDLEFTFIVPMSASWSKKKRRALIGQRHEGVGDLDNFLKSVFDALATEDRWISSTGKLKKIWGVEGRIVITDPNN